MKRNVKEEFIEWLKNRPKNITVEFESWKDERERDGKSLRNRDFGDIVFTYNFRIDCNDIDRDDVDFLCDNEEYLKGVKL